MRGRRPLRTGSLAIAGAVAGLAVAALGSALLALFVSVLGGSGECGATGSSIVLGPPGTGARAGASEYGGPGDPSSGTTGARGDSLLAHPDSYAELGGLSWQTATAMGGLAYMAPLRITWRGRSTIAYKRDFGFGGGPVDGLPRVIDLWWQLAGRLGIPYEHGQWSGPVGIERPPTAGAAGVLGQLGPQSAPPPDPAQCASVGGVPLVPGERARLLADGRAAAPGDAPLAVKQMIAAGNEIVGKPYLYGAAHGLPLSAVAPAYDCSSSVEHLLYGARLLPVTYGGPSADLEAFGEAGVGRWVTVYADADHVFMYVAGLRWDTHNAVGVGDGASGIGWHPLVRSAAGFVARHPPGL